MIRETLDNRIFRVTFAVLVGIPATLLYLIATIYGVVFGISLFNSFEVLSASLAGATILGTFGVIGAWLRIIKRSDKLSHKQLKFTRFSLACGIAASSILLCNAIWAGSYIFGVPLFLLTSVGVVIYVGT